MKMLIKTAPFLYEGDDFMKKIIMVCSILALVLALSACGNGNTAQGSNNPNGDSFTVDAIQDNPADYVGAITLIGVVGSSFTQDFALQGESGTFEVLVDYRGSQALPQLGTTLSVEGQLRENRPCCGPGFTLTAVRFEAVGN